MLILLGILQMLMMFPMYYLQISYPQKLFIVPGCIGALVLMAGSLVVASEKNPSRQMLKGCAWITTASLLGALLALCMYVSSVVYLEPEPERCSLREHPDEFFNLNTELECPSDYLEKYFIGMVVLLVLYDLSALILQGFLSVSSFKGLRGC